MASHIQRWSQIAIVSSRKNIRSGNRLVMRLPLHKGYKEGVSMILSRSYSIEDLVESDTARRNRIPNTPSKEVIDNLRNLAQNILQPIADSMSFRPYVTSGYRCPALNKLVGGVSTSQHITGCAADLRCYTDHYANNLVSCAKKTPYDQLILEQKGKVKWIHVSWAANPRHQLIDKWLPLPHHLI